MPLLPSPHPSPLPKGEGTGCLHQPPAFPKIPLQPQQANQGEEEEPRVPKALLRLLLHFERLGVLGQPADQIGQVCSGGKHCPPVIAARLSSVAASAEALSNSRSWRKTRNLARAVPKGWSFCVAVTSMA